METALRDLKAVRQIATALGRPFHRVDYAIQRLGLTEAARVGIVRLYSAEQADLIRRAIADNASAIGLPAPTEIFKNTAQKLPLASSTNGNHIADNDLRRGSDHSATNLDTASNEVVEETEV